MGRGGRRHYLASGDNGDLVGDEDGCEEKERRL